MNKGVSSDFCALALRLSAFKCIGSLNTATNAGETRQLGGESGVLKGY